MPQDNIVTWVTAVAYSLVVIFTFPLQIQPANNVLESYLFKDWPKSPKRQWGKNLSRMLVVFVCCVITVAMYDSISQLLEIASALSCVPMAFLLPAMFHLKECADTPFAKALDIIAMIVSVGIAIYAATNGVIAFVET